jgi:hypothetical protein
MVAAGQCYSGSASRPQSSREGLWRPPNATGKSVRTRLEGSASDPFLRFVGVVSLHSALENPSMETDLVNQ